MITDGYDDGWAEGFESWEELEELLHGEWDRVEHAASGLSLERADGLLAFDAHRRWHARHRRGLHRLGFRGLDLGRTTVWMWDVQPQLRATDLGRFAGPFEAVLASAASAASVAAAARIQRARTSLARDHLVREQTMRVLRNVFRCRPEDLAVLLVREDFGLDEDDAWALPRA